MKGGVPGVVFGVIAAIVFAGAPIRETKAQSPEPLQPLTVAFIGDQG